MTTDETMEFFSPESRREAIIEIREIPGTEDFFNAGAWEEGEGDNKKTYLLGRHVETAAEEGMPDVGSLVLKTLGPNGVESSLTVWQPKTGEPTLEDARVQRLPESKLAIGLTSVTQEGNDYIPYPAVLYTSTEELKRGKLPVPRVIRSMGGGDQTTPLGENDSKLAGKNVTAIGPNLFAFRPEGEKHHQLRVIECQEGSGVTHRQYINFPEDIPWAKWRVGTTMPPVWLNEDEAIFPIHGINKVDDKFVYSIGSARLLRDENGTLSVDNISQEPIIDPDVFAGMFDNDVAELHGERRVVYWCGGIPVYNDSGELEYLKGYINVGDKRTVEVTLSVAKLTKGWQRSEPTEEKVLVAV